MTDEKQFNTRLPNWLVKLIRADERPNKDVAVSAFTREFGGKRRSALEAQKEQKEQRLKAVRKEIGVLEDEASKLTSEIDDLETDIQNMQSPDEKYTNDIDGLLDQLESDALPAPRLQPLLCEDIADSHGKTPEEVHEDAKQRAAEQERDLMNTDFMSRREAERLSLSERAPISECMEDE